MATLFVGLTFPLIAATSAHAQTVVDPHVVEFDPSPDHGAVSGSGEPLVEYYELRFYLSGAAQSFQTAGVGKPAPQSNGKIQLAFLPSFPSSGITYEMRVAAVNAGGATESSPSNPFSFSGACSYVLSTSSISFSTAGGAGNVGVLAGSSCTWSGVSQASWIVPQAGTMTGAGTLNFTAAPNTGAARSTTLSIGGQAVTITQAGTSICSPTVSTASVSVPAPGAGGTIPVSANSECNWSSSSPASWVAISPASSIGSANLTYMAAANTSNSARTATLTVAGQPVVVTQAGVQCTPTVSANTVTVAAAATTGGLGVSAASGCAWTSSSPASWVTVSPASGSGAGSVNYSVQANNTVTPRTATLSVAGVPVTVTQTGVACTPTLSLNAVTALVSGSSGTVGVNAAAACTWTASSPASWVSVSPASGSGAGNVTFSVQPNTSVTSRTATLTIANLPVVVTQPGVACAPTVSTGGVDGPAAGSSGTIGVTVANGCAWTASSSAGWVTVSPASGNGSGTVTYSMQPNPTSTRRTATLNVAGTPVLVAQDGVQCVPTLSTSSLTAAASGVSGAMSVSVASACAWTASSPVSWATLSPASGSGAGNVSYSVQPNTSATARSATLTVAGQPLSVSQAGVACTPTLSVNAVTAPVAGSSGTVGVNAAAACTWTASSPASWVSVSPASGSASANVTYTVQSNTSTTGRSATLTIAGMPVVVNQAAATAICSYTLNPSSITVPGTGSGGSVTITAPAGCAWTTQGIDWIRFGTTSGQGTGTVAYTINPNPLPTARSKTVTVAGQPFTVTQAGLAGAACSVTVSTTTVPVGGNGGSGAIGVTTGASCPWTASSPVSWVTLAKKSGSGSASVSYTVAANTSLLPRMAQLNIGGKSVTISQDAACIITLTNVVMPAKTGGPGSATITTGASCSWIAESRANWLTITSPTGTGTGKITFTASPNPTGPARTGVILVSGNKLSITQK